MADSDILNDFLVELEVPHTLGYTAARYRDMPFKTLFGLSKLLDEYGVANEGLFLADKSELSKLSPPFLAHTGAGLVIVTAIDKEGRKRGLSHPGGDRDNSYGPFSEGIRRERTVWLTPSRGVHMSRSTAFTIAPRFSLLQRNGAL